MAEFGDLVFSPVVVPFLCFWIIGVVFITVFSVPALFLWVTALFAFALVEGFTTFGSGVTMFCVVLWLESVVSAERPSVARRFGPGLGISADSGFLSFFFVDEGEEEEATTASEREEAVGILVVGTGISGGAEDAEVDGVGVNGMVGVGTVGARRMEGVEVVDVGRMEGVEAVDVGRMEGVEAVDVRMEGVEVVDVRRTEGVKAVGTRGMVGVGAGGVEGIVGGGIMETGTGRGELAGILVVLAGRLEAADVAVVMFVDAGREGPNGGAVVETDAGAAAGSAGTVAGESLYIESGMVGLKVIVLVRACVDDVP